MRQARFTSPGRGERMKIRVKQSVQKEHIEALVKGVDAGLSFYLQNESIDNGWRTIQAIVAYPKTANAPHRLYDAKGKLTVFPCAAIQSGIASKVFGLFPDATLWLAKLEFDKLTLDHKVKALKSKLAGAFTCKGCAVAAAKLSIAGIPVIEDPSVSAGTFILQSGKPPKHVYTADDVKKYIAEPKTTKEKYAPFWDAPTESPLPKPDKPSTVKKSKSKFFSAAIEGPAITDGSGDANTWKNQTLMRDMEASVSGLYVLEEMNMTAEWEKCPEALVTKFKEFRKGYQARLARNLFDYLAIASMGEARHWNGNKGFTLIPQIRHVAWAMALKCDPRTFLPILSNIFHKGQWGGSYGGPKWGAISDGAASYFKYSDKPLMFSDHVVDLSHNGGPAFNKGIIFRCDNWPQYIATLDRKRDGSLLHGDHKLVIGPKVAAWLEMLKIFEVLDVDAKTIVEVKADPETPAMKWGHEQFTLTKLENPDNGVPVLSSPVQGDSGDHTGHGFEVWPKKVGK